MLFAFGVLEAATAHHRCQVPSLGRSVLGDANAIAKEDTRRIMLNREDTLYLLHEGAVDKEPAGLINRRWAENEGKAISSKARTLSRCIFTPSSPGRYRIVRESRNSGEYGCA